jgi:molybdopterin molybdotransferase
MITVDEAKKIIEQNTSSLPPVEMCLRDAAGKVLAEDVFAITDIPAFAQSSMDGYAFLLSEWHPPGKLRIEGEIPAGSGQAMTLGPGSAARIFTGAPVPAGADTVVMQEKTIVHNGELTISDEGIKAGANVRPAGSEIRAGELALGKDDSLSPAAVGFLAGLGITSVKVIPDPVISIIITGKELQQPGKPLEYGQVYESNSFTLATALNHLHFDQVTIARSDDDLEILTGVLRKALEQSDIVLLTGGVSVGDYDFVLAAAASCGVSTLFHKIKQRPGKPLFWGKKEQKIIVGLPGNPSSVLTCFYQYVLPALEILSRRKVRLKTLEVPLTRTFSKAVPLTFFLKGFYDGRSVSVLDAQESYKLSSFAKANCLVKIKEEAAECREGEKVEIYLLGI